MDNNKKTNDCSKQREKTSESSATTSWTMKIGKEISMEVKNRKWIAKAAVIKELI